jgi:hypothetical protein
MVIVLAHMVFNQLIDARAPFPTTSARHACRAAHLVAFIKLLFYRLDDTAPLLAQSSADYKELAGLHRPRQQKHCSQHASSCPHNFMRLQRQLVATRSQR